MVEAIRDESSSGASATKKTPSAKSESKERAASRLRRVLPMPGGPIRVTRRISLSNKYLRMSAISFSRPISDVAEEGIFERDCGDEICQGGSSTTPPGANRESPRANFEKEARSFGGIWNASANSSINCAEGRRSSPSILRSVIVEQLTCCASCSCVNPADFRWRLNHSPKEMSDNMLPSKNVSLSVSANDTRFQPLPCTFRTSCGVYHAEKWYLPIQL